MPFLISKILTEYEETPLGLEERCPRFSWRLESRRKNTTQTFYRVMVGTKIGQGDCMDSGRVESSNSTCVSYEGKVLEPCTTYYVTVMAWDNYGNHSQAESYFETGFLDSTPKPWGGARWLAAPRYTVCAENRGVFVIESVFRIGEGSSRAGIVFGANDARLLDSGKNELGLGGENYIRYEIDLCGEKTRLQIYRVGYAKEDSNKVPFATVEIPHITDTNKHDFHQIKIEIDGNNAFTYIDRTLIDYVTTEDGRTAGRTLNPRGHNDVLTYPRLNEIGFFAGEGDEAYFQYLEVKNMRAPGNLFISERPEGNLYSEQSLFGGEVEIREDCFYLSGRQITKNPSNTSIPMFRTSLDIPKKKQLVKARLYITSYGIYECMINGNQITDSLLNPGLTQYDKRINYQTYDITPLLQQGKNGIGVMLASGWYSEAQTFTVRNFNYFGDKEAFLSKIVLKYDDGSEEIHVSNTKQWKYYGDGPYLYSGFFAGEQIDARRMNLYEEYSLPYFEDKEFEEPVEYSPVKIEGYSPFPSGFGRGWPSVNDGQTKLIGGFHAPVFVVESRHAASVTEVEPGVWIYDLEQEMAGVPRILFREREGTKVIIRYAEVLYPDAEEYSGNVGKMMLENYRDATSTDVYICKGDSTGEIFQPKFTFHGYRFIEISGVENPPLPENVESLQYSSVREFEGDFKSSHQLLNRFFENVKWSQRCNFINIPTDCPQRNERMGWAGDTHVFCHTALQNSHLKLFYERNLQAMADLQTKEGQFPEIAPIGGGFGGITYECATIFMSYELYLQYGDLRTLKRFYPGMKRYMEYMKDSGLPGKGNFQKIGPLGDWLAPEDTDLQLLWNAFYYREADLMSKIADLIGDEKGAQDYRKLADQIQNLWNQTFLDGDTGMTVTMQGEKCDTQTSYALGMEYGVIKDKKMAGEHLLRKVKEGKYTVGTGFFGTGLLNMALCSAGYEKEAYRLMLQTQSPSWLYPITQGATTIWERWDSFTKEKGFNGQNAMNSFNHYSLGSVLSWMYSHILGIRRDENYPGFARFMLKPVIGELSYARGSVSTPYGTISSEWKIENKLLEYSCTIPVNTKAVLYLPGIKQELGSGEHTFHTQLS